MNARLKFGLITLSAVLTIVATLMLGRWQLHRAEQKEAIQSKLERQGELPQLEGRTVISSDDPGALMQRKVFVRGRWLADKTIFLDNRPMAGRQGLYVVTPLELEDGQTVVLVQRGWVPRNFMDRSLVPVIGTPGDSVTVGGRIAPPPGKLYEFAATESGLIRQNLNIKSFSAEIGAPLQLWTIQQLGADSDGMSRQWPVVVAGIEKHYGYAFQWFALSALIAILYVWFQIVRRFIFHKRT